MKRPYWIGLDGSVYFSHEAYLEAKAAQGN